MFPLVMARISTSTDKVFAKKTPQAKLYHKCLSCWGQLEEVGQREGGLMTAQEGLCVPGGRTERWEREMLGC